MLFVPLPQNVLPIFLFHPVLKKNCAPQKEIIPPQNNEEHSASVPNANAQERTSDCNDNDGDGVGPWVNIMNVLLSVGD